MHQRKVSKEQRWWKDIVCVALRAINKVMGQRSSWIRWGHLPIGYRIITLILQLRYWKSKFENSSTDSNRWSLCEPKTSLSFWKIHACLGIHPTKKEAVWSSSISAQWHLQSEEPFTQLIAFCNVEFLRPHNVDHSMNIWSLYQCHEDSSCLVQRSCSQWVPPLDKWSAHLLGIGLSVSNE